MWPRVSKPPATETLGLKNEDLNTLMGMVTSLKLAVLHRHEAPSLDDELIAQIQIQPILYDTKHADFGHKKKTNQVWRIIAKMIKLDIATCKIRWQELIDQFVKEYNAEFPALGQTTTPDDPIKGKTNSKLFEQMLWMSPYIPQLDKPQPDQNCKNTVPYSEIIGSEHEEETPTDNEISKSDQYFLLFLNQEMQKLPDKLKFKREVCNLLEKYDE